jgi:hypothetical protein
MKELIGTYGSHLAGKVVIDPSNPIGPDGNGGFTRTLPDGVSAGFGDRRAPAARGALRQGVRNGGRREARRRGNRSPDRAVLFYATDDATAASTAERLISAAGSDPLPVGGLDQAIRIEAFGDLHDMDGLNGRLLSLAGRGFAAARLTADQAPAQLNPRAALPQAVGARIGRVGRRGRTGDQVQVPAHHIGAGRVVEGLVPAVHLRGAVLHKYSVEL